tara:strand:+ start:13414 stop:15042 length:1629 start_codon:yes stop_codon:yes gene_type:complete
MHIAIAQLNYHIGNFEANEQKIIQSIQKAKAEKADLIVFAELSICGYPPRDFLEFDDFLAECEASIQRIALHCDEIAAIVGAPSSNHDKGKNLYNSAYFLKDKGIHSIHHKQLLPTYDVFDENRYFEPGDETQIIEYKNKKIAITICEDIWNLPKSNLYKKVPLDSLSTKTLDLHINIAASPFSVQQESKREKVLKWNATNYEVPVLYVNHVGAQTELVFDGNSCLYNSLGYPVLQLAAFEEDFQIFDETNLSKLKPLSKKIERYEKMEKALILGISDYFKKLKFQKATLGLSGGIDSALTLALAIKALGKESVIPILMPSQFSSNHSIEDSLKLCETLGCLNHLIEIESIYKAFIVQLEPLFNGTEFGIAEENIQSRVRGSLLMAHTNKFGTILLNTSNKSELAVGYGTLYGDMSGGLSVLGDVYKTEVFELSKWINRNEEIIPSNIITKPPSAELRPDQKDTDSLPEYETLDPLLKAYIEDRLSPKKLIEKGFDENLVKKIIRLVNINEYKRYQAPPILRVSEKAFGMGRRMPIVGKYLS